MDLVLHFKGLVILLSPGFTALLHHELVLSDCSHLLSNLDVLSLFRSRVKLVSLVFNIGVPQLGFLLSELIN